MRTSNEKIDRIYVSRITRKANYKMPMAHIHNYYELYYVENGSCSIFTSASVTNLTTGDFALIPPGISHYVYYHSSCTRVNIYFNFSELLDQGLPFCRGIAELTAVELGHMPGPYRPNLGIIIEQLINEGRLNDSYSEAMSTYMLRIIFMYLLRCAVEKTDGRKSENDTAVADTVTYIDTNVAADLSLHTLAGRAGLSDAYFSKKFKSETGMGLKEFVTLTRLKEAEKELLGTDHRIEEVATNNGFSDGNYFKDCFRKTYGLSPSKYRKENAGDRKLLDSMTNDGV